MPSRRRKRGALKLADIEGMQAACCRAVESARRQRFAG
jgi:hypothetical protein